MITAKMPDGTRLAFDDETPQSTIDAAAKRYIAMCEAGTKPANIVVNVPPTPEQPAPQIKVEVVQEAPAFLKDLAEAIGASNKLTATLVAAIDTSTKDILAELKKSSSSVADQMRRSSNAVTESANHLYAALTASKEVELDSLGNPVRITVKK